MTQIWETIRSKKKDRERKVAKAGGYDFSYVDKKFIKDSNGDFYYCKWCSKPMYVHTMHRSKGILLSCESDECIGNADLSDVWRQAKLKQMGLDRKLGPQLIITKHMTNQNWIDEKGYI